MLRALRAATVGGSEPPNCRFQISDCKLRGLRAATGGLKEGRRKNAECRMQNEVAGGAATAGECKMHDGRVTADQDQGKLRQIKVN